MGVRTKPRALENDIVTDCDYSDRSCNAKRDDVRDEGPGRAESHQDGSDAENSPAETSNNRNQCKCAEVLRPLKNTRERGNQYARTQDERPCYDLGSVRNVQEVRDNIHSSETTPRHHDCYDCSPHGNPSRKRGEQRTMFSRTESCARLRNHQSRGRGDYGQESNRRDKRVEVAILHRAKPTTSDEVKKVRAGIYRHGRREDERAIPSERHSDGAARSNRD